MLELSVSFESKLKNNLSKKKEKYKELTKVLRGQFKKVTFVNLAISALGVFASESSTLLINMLTEFGFDNKDQKYVSRNMMNIKIRTTY